MPINEKMDMFSLGCIMYYLLFFKEPFIVKTEHMSDEYDSHVGERDPTALQILYGLLETDPKRRFGSSHVWSMIDGLNLREQLTQEQPVENTQADSYPVLEESKQEKPLSPSPGAGAFGSPEI